MPDHTENDTIAGLAFAAAQSTHLASIDCALVPAGYKLESLDSARDAPRRITHTFTSADPDSWARYVAPYYNDTVGLYCGSHRTPYVQAVLDENAPGAPGWRAHTAMLKPETSEEWAAWHAVFNKAITQKAFAEFIDDHREDVAAIDGWPSAADMVTVSREFQAIRKGDFKSATNLSNGSLQFQFEDTVRGTTKAGQVEVPQAFKVSIPRFEHQPALIITVRLRFKLSGEGGLSFTLTPYRLDRAQKEAWSELRLSATDALAKHIGGTRADDFVFLA